MKTAFAIAVAVLVGSVAIGQVPELINYQGRLEDAGGPLTGTVNLTFRFYDAATGGSALLTVEQTGVVVTEGIFNVLIGSGTVTGPKGTLSTLFTEYVYVWMSTEVGTDGEMTPRKKMSSVPYALHAGKVNTAWLDAYLADSDYDGDGHLKLDDGGDDCDDSRATVYPGATEIPGDGIDQNCDGMEYWWTRRIGGTTLDQSNAVATDGSGNVFVTGLFEGTVIFGNDWGAGDSKTSLGSYDIFVTKVDAAGNYGWTHRMGGTGQDRADDMAIDGSGNVYVVGYFTGTVDFAQDWGGDDSRTSAGVNDIFVTKVNADGTYGWSHSIGGTGYDCGYGVTADGNGNVYVTGAFNGTVNFAQDWGESESKTSAGGNDAFVTKVNSDGTYGWTRRMGSTGHDLGFAMATDNSGNLYVTGAFNGTVNFAQDWGESESKTSAGGNDAFVTRVNADGTYGWTHRMGGTGEDDWADITVDGSENVYVTARFYLTVNFADDWGGSDPKTSAGGLDIFVTKLGADGSYDWTHRIGGTGTGDTSYDIGVDGNGNIYVAGHFDSTEINFAADWGGTDSKTCLGGPHDVFVTKVNADGTYAWSRRMGDTGNDAGFAIAVEHSGNVYLTGIFSSTVNFAADFGGTDSKTSAGSYDIFVTKISE